jgi:hypothetical protein
MSSSSISRRLKESGDLLLKGVSSQVRDYSQRFKPLDRLHQGLLRDLVKSNFNYGEARETAINFFGTDQIPFISIDGTEYTNSMYDLIVFFGGSYLVKGTLELNQDKPKIHYSPRLMKGGIGISSCIPLYINQILEVERANPEGEFGVNYIERPVTDESLINNSQIANWIMTFSEFYLAYEGASRKDHPKLILMDRSLLTMVSSLIYDTRRRKNWKKMALMGMEIEGKKIDRNDLLYNRYRLINQDLDLPSPRGDYLRYTIAYLIEEEGTLSYQDISALLEIESKERQKRLKKLLERSVEENYLVQEGDHYTLNPHYTDSWLRIKKAVLLLGAKLFHETEGTNPMRLERDGVYRWLTVLDLAFLTLFTINMLIQECWRRNILLVGITKDTTARDFKTHLIPVMCREGFWDLPITVKSLERAPNTDRMLLQYLSAINHDELPTPWATIEFDSAFRMIIPELEEKRKGHVSGAIRNRILYERLFLKSYIQLSQASTDPQLRSNVLFVDRLAYPEIDNRTEVLVNFIHKYSGVEEPLDVILYKDKGVENPIQNLVMVILKMMEKPSIPEAFGHNVPLFMADKIAKWHAGEMRRIIDSTRLWVSNSPSLRRHMFYMSTFRERRTDVEQSRRTS